MQYKVLVTYGMLKDQVFARTKHQANAEALKALAIQKGYSDARIETETEKKKGKKIERPRKNK